MPIAAPSINIFLPCAACQHQLNELRQITTAFKRVAEASTPGKFLCGRSCSNQRSPRIAGLVFLEYVVQSGCDRLHADDDRASPHMNCENRIQRSRYNRSRWITWSRSKKRQRFFLCPMDQAPRQRSELKATDSTHHGMVSLNKSLAPSRDKELPALQENAEQAPYGRGSAESAPPRFAG